MVSLKGPQGYRHVRRCQGTSGTHLRIFESPNLHQCRLHCGDPWVDEHGREWLTLEICHLAALKVLSEVARSCEIRNCRGADSFLTHQIRKMVATAALAARPRQREMHKSDEKMKNDENIEHLSGRTGNFVVRIHQCCPAQAGCFRFCHVTLRTPHVVRCSAWQALRRQNAWISSNCTAHVMKGRFNSREI